MEEVGEVKAKDQELKEAEVKWTECTAEDIQEESSLAGVLIGVVKIRDLTPDPEVERVNSANSYIGRVMVIILT